MSTNPDDYENKNESGFLNPKHTKPRVQKMKWDAQADRKLLLLGLGREMSNKEYKVIAGMFREKPTPKSIQERYTKLRGEQKELLKTLGISGPQTSIHPVREEDLVDDDEATTTTPSKTYSPDTMAAAGGLVRLSEASSTSTSDSGKKRKQADASTPTPETKKKIQLTPEETLKRTETRRHTEARLGVAEKAAREEAEKLKKLTEEEAETELMDEEEE